MVAGEGGMSVQENPKLSTIPLLLFPLMFHSYGLHGVNSFRAEFKMLRMLFTLTAMDTHGQSAHPIPTKSNELFEVYDFDSIGLFEPKPPLADFYNMAAIIAKLTYDTHITN